MESGGPKSIVSDLLSLSCRKMRAIQFLMSSGHSLRQFRPDVQLDIIGKAGYHRFSSGRKYKGKATRLREGVDRGWTLVGLHRRDYLSLFFKGKEHVIRKL